MIEDFENKQENVDANPTDNLETIDTPLEAAEIEEFQENLKEIEQLEPEEKISFAKKIAKNISKIPGSMVMVGGAAVGVAGLYLAGDSFVETLSHANFHVGEREVAPEVKQEVVLQMKRFLVGCSILVGSLLTGIGAKEVNTKIDKSFS